LHILIVHQTVIMYSKFHRSTPYSSWDTYFQNCQKMDSTGNITALYSTEGAETPRQNFNYNDSMWYFIHTQKWRLYLVAHISKTASENRAHFNKVSCLHIHCAVMNCVTAPICSVWNLHLLQCWQKLASPLPGH